MRFTRQTIALAVMALAFPVLSEAADIGGYWLTQEPAGHRAVIQIEKAGEVYDGRIAALEEPRYPPSEGPEKSGKTKTDENNPDPKLRDRPLIGLAIVSGFKPDGPGKWNDARIYNPDDGETYRCKATLSEDGQHLQVRGFLGISLLGKTQEWIRRDSASAAVFGAAR